MPWRPHGHFDVNPTSPRALGDCDRCYRTFNLERLQWQFEWRGNRLMNLRVLVCSECLDRPQEQNRPIILPPDPVPVFNPRPENFASDNAGGITVPIESTIYYDEPGVNYDASFRYEP